MCSEDFDEFFRCELGRLVAFVRRAGFSLELARDAAQEAMIKAYEQWASLREPRAWVRLVAYRTAQAEVVRAKDGVFKAVAGGWTVSTHHDPDIAVLSHEHEQLLRYLAELPPRQRLVIAWHLDGFSNTEIADHAAMPPATVRSNLRHARTALKALLAAEETVRRA